jgi:hypothetical protein
MAANAKVAKVRGAAAAPGPAAKAVLVPRAPLQTLMGHTGAVLAVRFNRTLTGRERQTDRQTHS